MDTETRSLSPEEQQPLTPQQERFCEEYLIDLNGTQAAIRAKYSPASAGQQACELLKLPKIRARIDIALAERSKRTGINADRVLLELARLGLANPIDVVDAMDATVKLDAVRDDTAAIQSVRVKVIPTKEGNIVEREIRMYDKIRALELLGKHQGMFPDRKEITGKNGGPVEVAGRVQGMTKAELIGLLKKAAEATGGEPDGDASP